MFDALIHRQNRDISGAGKSAVVMNGRQRAKRLRIAVRIGPDAVEKIRRRKMQHLLVHFSFMIQKVVSIRSEQFSDL